MGEIIFGATLILSLVGWTALLFKKKTAMIYWLVTMSMCTVAVIGMEIFSKITTGFTISKHYWEWSLQNEALSWVACALMLGGWINLLVHLQWKVLKRRFSKE